MSIKTALTAMLLLSATALPALAENYANDPARPDAPVILQQPLFGGIVGAQPGTTSTANGSTAWQEASAKANAVTRTDATTGSSAAAPSTSAHMYDFLSGPEYRGGA
jgi:hypothetical protein